MTNERIAMFLGFFLAISIIGGFSACDYRSKARESEAEINAISFNLKMAGLGYCKPFNAAEWRPCGDLLRGAR